VKVSVFVRRGGVLELSQGLLNERVVRVRISGLVLPRQFLRSVVGIGKSPRIHIPSVLTGNEAGVANDVESTPITRDYIMAGFWLRSFSMSLNEGFHVELMLGCSEPAFRVNTRNMARIAWDSMRRELTGVRLVS